jgi:hypothetical protein
VGFFPEVTDRSRLDVAERATVEELRGLLRDLGVRSVRPDRTSARRTPRGAVELRILHAQDGTCLTLELEGSSVALRWVGGELRERWGPDVRRAVRAFLTGRNELALHLRLGRVHTVETTVWDAPGRPVRLLHRRRMRGIAAAACRALPGADRVERMSVSFDRDEGLGPPVGG